MSDMTFGPRDTENYELAVANRKLTTAILGMTLLTGLVACLSYLAGRTVTRIQTPPAEIAATVGRTVNVPVVVEAAKKPSPLTAVPAPVAAPAPPAPRPLSSIPAVGSYLQVGLVDVNLSESIRQDLQLKGYAALVAPGEGPSSARLLVGPIREEDRAALQLKLESHGYQSFLRRY